MIIAACRKWMSPSNCTLPNTAKSIPETGSHVSAGLELEAGVRAGTSYIYELECLRGLAILLVFLFHVWGISMAGGGGQPSVAMSFVVSGNTGVTLFFVLSGFLLSRPWLASMQDHTKPSPSIKNYYVARVLRILPLYYCAVLIAIAASGNWMAGLKALAFGFVGFDIFPYSVVWWTLSTEVQFYLLLPLIFAGLMGGRIGRALTIALFAGWLYWYASEALLAEGSIVKSYLLTKSIFARLPAFLIGIITCWIYLRGRYWRTDSTLFRLMFAATAIAALLVLGNVLQRAAILGDWAAEGTWHIHHTYEATLWAVLLLTLLLCDLPGKRVLVNNVMAVMGKLSYSLYLVHVPILFYTIYPIREGMGQERYIESPCLFITPVLAFLLSMLVSYITYRLIELPFLNMKHRLTI